MDAISHGKSVRRIALVNNMPDAALARTERQFHDFLEMAAYGQSIALTRCYLPGIPRDEGGLRYLAGRYVAVEDLKASPPDAVVVTGCEPRRAELREEPYWGALANLVDILAALAIPTLFSCLAAHAAVLRTDGIVRVPLSDKRFGIFQHHNSAPGNRLMRGAAVASYLPHSRWNDVPAAALDAAGYTVLTQSEEAGVGFFASNKHGPWLFCQGHPEYDTDNLLREYRRDVQRFLSGEREVYPRVPAGCYSDQEVRDLVVFEDAARGRRNIETMARFPAKLSRPSTSQSWQANAACIVRNWLEACDRSDTFEESGVSNGIARAVV